MLCGVCAAAQLKISAFSGIIKNTLGEWFFQPISTTSTYQGEVLICLQLECVRESSGPEGTIWRRRGRGRLRMGTLFSFWVGKALAACWCVRGWGSWKRGSALLDHQGGPPAENLLAALFPQICHTGELVLSNISHNPPSIRTLGRHPHNYGSGQDIFSCPKLHAQHRLCNHMRMYLSLELYTC